MKFNFKKVASIIASSVMLSSTIGFAAAANYPAPFTDGAAVVYGSAGAQTDMAAAIDVYDQLKGRVSGSTDASVSGDAKAVETASQPLYLGDYMNGTKSTFTKEELKTVLASGKLTDEDGKEYAYDLKISVPNARNIYGDTIDNLASPVVFTDLDSTAQKYTMKIIFPTAVNITKLTNEGITLFGKQYVFSGNTADLTTSSITLFEKATPVIINDGESKTVDTHTITVAVEDADTASITVDGVTSTKNEGQSGKINGVDLYVKNVVGPNVAGTSRYVELYLNSNKIVLPTADLVERGASDVDGTNVTITSSSGKVSEIAIDIIPKSEDPDVRYLKMGGNLVDPVFNTLKLELTAATPDLTSDSRDLITIKPTGEQKAGIKFTNKAGKLYDMDMLGVGTVFLNATYGGMANASDQTRGTFTYNGVALEVDNQYNITTSASANVTENGYFITCSNEYTQIWQLNDVKMSGTAREVKVKDQGSGSESVTVTMAYATGNTYTGSLSLADGNTATITAYSDTNETIAVTSTCPKLYTKKGAMIDLSFANNVNQSEVVIREETSYNGGDFKDNLGTTLGKNITIRFLYDKTGRSGKDMRILDTMYSGISDADGNPWVTSGYSLDSTYFSDDVGDYDYYYVTKYGTFIKQTGDTDKQVDVYYPEDAMKLGFYIGEVASAITPGTTGSAGGQIAIVKDTEVASVSGKHLFVVGGSCVNQVAAKILGSDKPLCAQDFSAVTKVGANGYIIKVVKSPYNDQKVAMLVAGYEAAQTQDAVKRAMVIDGVKTDVGSEETYPVTATV